MDRGAVGVVDDGGQEGVFSWRNGRYGGQVSRKQDVVPYANRKFGHT